MFQFDGIPSQLSAEVQRVLASIRRLTLEEANDSFTFVLYRIDPLDRHHYLLAHAGLRQVEPMFGPKTQEDFRDVAQNHNARGFRQREGIPPTGDDWHRHYGFHDYAALWVGRRADAKWETWEAVEADVTEKLDDAFHEALSNDTAEQPLYPELWYKEHVTRDRIRSAVYFLGATPDMKTVASTLTQEINTIFSHLPELSHGLIQAGIYLVTGEGWELCGKEPITRILPRKVFSRAAVVKGETPNRAFPPQGRDSSVDSENAFEWIYSARRSVLLRKPISRIWLNRLQGCSMYDTVERHHGSMVIVPILDSHDSSLTIGILVINASGSEPLNPAHLHLANRLSYALASFLGTFMPLRGFPWWPTAKLSRGGATVIWEPHTDPLGNDHNPKSPHNPASGNRSSFDSGSLHPEVRQMLEDLLPSGATVKARPLEKGLTDAALYRLDADDEKGVQEIPRVLKVGPASIIGDELHRYYRYVHNKNVGGQARVDVARGYPHLHWSDFESSKHKTFQPGVGAILYTFVGMGDRAVAWHQWGKTADEAELAFGIDRLHEHLYCWHVRMRGENGKLSDVATPTEVIKRQLVRCKDEGTYSFHLENPTIEETVKLLYDVQAWSRGTEKIATCIVHGDTHCGNVFALLNQNGKIYDVALIDWGKVRSGCHSSIDSALLLSDLIFQVRWDKTRASELISWGKKRFESVEGNMSVPARVIWIVQLLRMLSWRWRHNEQPVWKAEARQAAWDFANSLWDEVRSSTKEQEISTQ